MTCQTDKKILRVVTVYRINNGLGCALLDTKHDGVEDYLYFSGFKEVDDFYINAVKDMVTRAKEKIGDYKTEVVIENMVPESERDKLEEPRPLTNSEYRNILKQLKM